MRLSLISTMLLVCCVSGAVFADEWDSSQLGQARFGNQWNGPTLTKENLQNRLVFVGILGTHTTSANAINTMAKLDRNYAGRGLVVIGVNHFQIPQDERMDDLKKAGAKFALYNGANLDFELMARKGVKKATNRFYLPYCVIYGPDGNMVWSNKFPPSYSKAAAEVEKGLKLIRSPADLKRETQLREILEGEDLSEIKDIAKLVMKFNLGRAISVSQKAAQKDNDRGKQAKVIMDKLESLAQGQLDSIKDDAYKQPSETLNDLRNFARLYASSEFATKAKSLEGELRSDKEFQASLASEDAYDKIAKQAKRIPYAEDYGKSYEQWLAQFGKRLDKLKKDADDFKGKYPKSVFCVKVDDLISSFDEEQSEDDDEKTADYDKDSCKKKKSDDIAFDDEEDDNAGKDKKADKDDDDDDDEDDE